jgi:hypothetical protein
MVGAPRIELGTFGVVLHLNRVSDKPPSASRIASEICRVIVEKGLCTSSTLLSLSGARNHPREDEGQERAPGDEQDDR